jgi:hypothetical protein
LQLAALLSCFVLPDGPDFFHSIKKSAKNLVKNNLSVFSMDCLSPIDGFLTRPQGGMFEGVEGFVVIVIIVVGLFLFVASGFRLRD